jgi:hypothetical protein
VQSRCEISRDKGSLDAAGAQDVYGAKDRSRGINGHVRRTHAQNAVDRCHGFETLGEPQADPVTASNSPPGQPSAQAISAAPKCGIAEPAAVLVFDGRMIRTPKSGGGEQLA